MQNTNDNNLQCKRCGACCRKGGPALHEEDMPLVQDGTIQLSDIVTLRPGERVYDQPAQSILPLETEILKIKGRDNGWTCINFSPDGQNCGIYETRPLECELLFCLEPEALSAVYDKTRLTRASLLPENHPLLELIEEHDKQCSPILMEETAKKAREGDDEAGVKLKEIVLFDMEVRRLVAEKSGTNADITEFLFGRPLRVLLGTMNIKVYEMGDSVRFSFAQGA
ncbi:MAG: zinc/iron-chelating domain-containing protein [Desulfovibrio sp.]|nr:zinc/iron-chelating domain-containing protein [Desulfovibrio sp.]